MRVFRYFLAVLLTVGMISTVIAQGPEPNAKLMVIPPEVKLEPGQGQRFEAVLFTSNGAAVPIERVVWSAVPDSVGFMSDDGFFIAGRKEGEAKVIAIAHANGFTYEGTAHVIIGKLPILPFKVVVEPQDAVVPPGASQQYTVTVVTPTGEIHPSRVRWEVHPRNLGTISDAGLFTAGNALGFGNIVAFVEVAGVVLRGDARVTIAPAPSAAIAGKVTDETSGQPIENAVVFAERIGELRWSARAKTDASGNYVIEKLIPGLYVLRADARAYLPEFYQEASQFTEADLVELSENENKTGINFTLLLGSTISGQVTTETDAAPLEGAHVAAILRIRPDLKHHAVTDADGNYAVTGLPKGDFVILAAAAGYKEEFYKDARSLNEAQLLSVDPPQTVDGINLDLAMASAITGKVTDAGNGEPIAKAVVSIHAIFSTTPRPEFVREVLTDEKGEYIASVRPGVYYVSAVARGYQKEFYQESPDIRQATRVEVLADQHKTGIDFTLAKLGSISGNVKDQATGQPLAGAIVTAFPERTTTDALISPEELHRPLTAITDNLGNYIIENLRSGKYFVTADARGYLREFWEESAIIDTADIVEVPESGLVEDINFTLEKGGAISGTVYAEDGRPLPKALVQVFRRGNDPLGRDYTDEQGKYRIGGLRTGEYLVFAIAEGFKGVFYPDAETRDQATPVKVEAPNETEGIDFKLKKIETRFGAITGVVVTEGPNEIPIPHGLVLAIPLTPGRVHFTIADLFGHYKLTGLPPGRYIALACAPGFVCEFYENARTWLSAKIIGVESGSVVDGINFSLVPSRRGPYHITGRVRRGGDNRGADNTIVQALENGVAVASTVTENDGSFTLDELPAGEYKIYATGSLGSGYFGGTDEQSASAVSVGERQNVSNIDLVLLVTGVGESTPTTLPTRFVLEQNYPNPFNPETSIKYQLPIRTPVTLRIYNALGQEVRTLVNGVQDAGIYAIQWNGKDNHGRPLSAGIYLFRLEAGGFVMTRKMAMVK